MGGPGVRTNCTTLASFTFPIHWPGGWRCCSQTVLLPSTRCGFSLRSSSWLQACLTASQAGHHRRELLLDAQTRAHPAQDLQDTRRRPAGCVSTTLTRSTTRGASGSGMGCCHPQSTNDNTYLKRQTSRKTRDDSIHRICGQMSSSFVLRNHLARLFLGAITSARSNHTRQQCGKLEAMIQHDFTMVFEQYGGGNSKASLG